MPSYLDLKFNHESMWDPEALDQSEFGSLPYASLASQV